MTWTWEQPNASHTLHCFNDNGTSVCGSYGGWNLDRHDPPTTDRRCKTCAKTMADRLARAQRTVDELTSVVEELTTIVR